MAINGIALATTLFIMAPVGYEIAENIKAAPLDLSNVQTLLQTGSEAIKPLRAFMLRNVDPDVLTHLLENTSRLWPAQLAREVQREDLILLIPAFVLSQLQAGFEIGFLIYIPLIVIDLIVSNLLLALGMQMVSPMTISLPLKLLLFVMVSGWSRLLDSLFLSYLCVAYGTHCAVQAGHAVGGCSIGTAVDRGGGGGRDDVSGTGVDAGAGPDVTLRHQAGGGGYHVDHDRPLDWRGADPTDQPDL